jgi:hypothetical protein
MIDSPGVVSVRCVPAGAAVSEARIGLDCVEVRVSYRAR